MERNWERITKEHYEPQFTNIDEFSATTKNIDAELKTPYNYFRLFFDDIVMENIIKYTNKYALHKKQIFQNNYMLIESDEESTKTEIKSKVLKTAMKWKNINKEKLEQFIGNLTYLCNLAAYIYLHIHQLPDNNLHWSKNKLFRTPASEMISDWKFKIIQMFLYVSDPKEKGLNKINFLINHINEKCKQYYNPCTINNYF